MNTISLKCSCGVRGGDAVSATRTCIIEGRVAIRQGIPTHGKEQKSYYGEKRAGSYPFQKSPKKMTYDRSVLGTGFPCRTEEFDSTTLPATTVVIETVTNHGRWQGKPGSRLL